MHFLAQQIQGLCGSSEPPSQVPNRPGRVTSFHLTGLAPRKALHVVFALLQRTTALVFVGGSFSARVPKSSAELHKVDRQEEGQDDQREGGEEREVNGVGEVNQRDTRRRCA